MKKVSLDCCCSCGIAISGEGAVCGPCFQHHSPRLWHLSPWVLHALVRLPQKPLSLTAVVAHLRLHVPGADGATQWIAGNERKLAGISYIITRGDVARTLMAKPWRAMESDLYGNATINGAEVARVAVECRDALGPKGTVCAYTFAEAIA